MPSALPASPVRRALERTPRFASQVDLVDTFVLAAGSSKTIVVSYRSQQQMASTTSGTERDDMRREDSRSVAQSRYATVEERAALKIRYAPCSEEDMATGVSADSATALAAATMAYARAMAAPAQQLLLQLIAKRCRSRLHS